MSDLLVEPTKVGKEFSIVFRENSGYEAEKRVFVRLIWARPTSVHHRLASGLDDVCLHSLNHRGTTRRIERPDAEERLIEKVLLTAIRYRVAVHCCLEQRVEFRPTFQMIFPLGRHLGNRVQPRPDVFASFRIVSCAGVEASGPTPAAFFEKRV